MPVWGLPLTQQLLQRLERMQNQAVRLCKHLSKFDHISEHYHQLKWLPLRKLIQLHSVHLMYCQYHRTKCIPLMPPIEFGPCQSRYDTRTAAHFANPTRFRFTFSQNIFCFTVSQWWNNLPTSLYCIIKGKCLKKFYNGYNVYFRLFSYFRTCNNCFLFLCCCICFCFVVVILFLCYCISIVFVFIVVVINYLVNYV